VLFPRKLLGWDICRGWDAAVRVYQEQRYDFAMARARLVLQFERLDLMVIDVGESNTTMLPGNLTADTLHESFIPVLRKLLSKSWTQGITYRFRLYKTSMQVTSS
jgi:hypothetical protein